MSFRKPCAVGRLFVLCAGLAWVAAAAPQLTTIEDTLYKADGTPFDGLLIITWKSFEAADSANVTEQVKTVRVVEGHLRVQLSPSSTAIPAFTYSVRYNSDGKVQFDERWLVPPSPQALRVRDVRTVGQLSGVPPARLQEADITGLTQDLLARPTKGAGYTPGAVAWINAEGSLESVGGNPTDCVRVDGSALPCATPAVLTFVDSATPSGALDGSNRVFTLPSAPNPVASLLLFRNGVLQRAGQEFTLAGATITFAVAEVPQIGDALQASYRLNPSGGSPAFADGETPAGAVDGTNLIFTLSRAPSPAVSLQLYRNGLLMKATLDYTLSGQTITFLSASKPASGDVLLAYYRY